MSISKHVLNAENGLVIVKASCKFKVLRIEQSTNGGLLHLEERPAEMSSHGFLVTNSPQNHQLPHPSVPEQKMLGSFMACGKLFEVWGVEHGRI